jgi:hypothetical protein
MKEPEDFGTPEYYRAFREVLEQARQQDRARHKECGGFAVLFNKWHCMTCEGEICVDELCP